MDGPSPPPKKTAGVSARVTEAALVAGACLLVVAAHVTHWWNERPLMCGDNAKHYVTAHGMLASLREASGWSDTLRAVLHPWTEYPPLTYAWTCAVFQEWGASEDIATLGQIAWVVAMAVTIYLFMRHRAGTAVAIIAVLLVATSPVIANAMVHFSPDLPLAATSFAALALLASDPGFTSRRTSISLGLAIALSLLAKWTALLYLAVPLAVATIVTLVAAGSRGRWRFVMLSGVLANLAAAIPFVVAHDAVRAQAWATIAALLMAGAALHLLGDDADRPLANLFLALLMAWALTAGVYAQLAPRLTSRVSLAVFEGVPLHQQLRVLSTVAVAGIFALPVLVPIGLVMLVGKRGQRAFRWIGLAFVSGLVLTAAAQVPHPRYYAPLIPLAAVLATGWIASLRARSRLVLTTLLLAATIAQSALLFSGDVAQGGAPRGLSAWLETWSLVDQAETMDIGPQPVLRARMAAVIGRLEGLAPDRCITTLVLDDGLVNPPASAWEALSIDEGRPLVVQQLALRDNGFRVEARPWNLHALSRQQARDGGDRGDTGYAADVLLVVASPDRLSSVPERLARETGRRYPRRTELAWPDGIRLLIMQP